MWNTPADVPDDSATSHQLTLMETFADGEMTRAEFVREWLAARRLAADTGEPVQGRLAALLDGVTSDVEDYAVEPAPAEAADPSDDPLRAEVDQARIDLTSL
ncbi:hypothetical protein ACWEVD_19525 [Nocardia thailandica]|uniref:hypothetical protein n=1 Tax=Nocardia thailandica TaxID=257275 RepID=UPI0002D7B2F9|nr:hypothetical protein [Nocardia thailandica]